MVGERTEGPTVDEYECGEQLISTRVLCDASFGDLGKSSHELPTVMSYYKAGSWLGGAPGAVGCTPGATALWGAAAAPLGLGRVLGGQGP